MTKVEKVTIPEGYKQTEVGVIPEDWEVLALSHFVSALEAGISVNSIEAMDEFSHGKSVLKTSCISGGYFYPSEGKGIIPLDLGRAKLNPRQGSIIISRMNTPALVGEVGYIDKNYPDLYLPDRLWQTKYVSEERVNGRWLAFTLSYPDISKKIKEVATGTSDSMKNISKGSLLSVVFPAPEIKEQTAIANALSDVDNLIAALETLIAKKSAIKTAAMQQLLTGKTRLPAFANQCEEQGEKQGQHQPAGSASMAETSQIKDSTQTAPRPGYKQTELGEIPEDWEVVELSQYVENNRLPSGLYKDQALYGSGTKIIKLGDVFKLDKFDPAVAQRAELTSEEKRLYKVVVGDIFIALASVKLEGVGKVMLVSELDEVTAYDHNVALIRLQKESDYKYLFYMLKSNAIRSQVKMNATQVGTSFLKASTILGFSILIPSKQEQTAIANVLSDMDAELDALQQRLSKTQQIKQGMMQELLTGKTRLI